VDGAFWLIRVGLTGALVAAVFGVLGPVPDETPTRHAKSTPKGIQVLLLARRSVRLAAPAYSP
jgi:hypothetical protein